MKSATFPLALHLILLQSIYLGIIPHLHWHLFLAFPYFPVHRQIVLWCRKGWTKNSTVYETYPDHCDQWCSIRTPESGSIPEWLQFRAELGMGSMESKLKFWKRFYSDFLTAGKHYHPCKNFKPNVWHEILKFSLSLRSCRLYLQTAGWVGQVDSQQKESFHAKIYITR